MKGFLFGVFFAIRGMFQLFGSMAIFLFSSQTIWENSVMREHPPVVSSLSRCILFVCIVIMNLVLFIVAAKRYKHWEREDRPYDQWFAVDFYTHVVEILGCVGTKFDHLRNVILIFIVIIATGIVCLDLILSSFHWNAVLVWFFR